MIIEKGEKVHLMVRPNFENDLRRHFVGTIMEVSDNCMRVKGYAFVFDKDSYQYYRKPELRERVISLIDSRNIINIIPLDVEIEKVKYDNITDSRGKTVLVATDGAAFTLDINEFSYGV